MSAAIVRRLGVCAPMLPFLAVVALAQPAPRTIKVSDATGVRLSLTEPLSSATNKEDDPVRFEVTEDVKVGDIVAIPKGSTAVGHIVDVEPRKRMGRAGKLNFSVDHVKAPDGTNVRLRASATRKGEDKTGTVIIGSVVLSPLFMIMRGKDINIPAGTEIMAYVDGDREISLSSPSATAVASAPPSTPPTAAVSIRSAPDGADVTVDGKYTGSAPSTLQLPPGDHVILIEKSGFTSWQRTLSVAAGSNITINASLDRK